MISFFGLKDILAKKRLWINEKEHSALIKKLKVATSFNLPNQFLEEIFPFGWKSPEVINKKKGICSFIFYKCPIPLPPSKPIEELSEEELRSFIEKLDISFERQFEECIKLIYNLDSDDKSFLKIKEYIYKKFKKSCKQNITLALLCFSCIVLALIVTIFPLILGTRISDTQLMCAILPVALIFIIYSMFAFSRYRYFRLNNGNYPSLD